MTSLPRKKVRGGPLGPHFCVQQFLPAICIQPCLAAHALGLWGSARVYMLGMACRRGNSPGDYGEVILYAGRRLSSGAALDSHAHVWDVKGESLLWCL